MKAACALLLLLFGCRPAPGTAPEPLRVAAAADLSLAFEEIGALYRAETGQSLSLSFGSTGLLAKQISEGGPFDVFAAANVSFVDQVIGAGRCDASTKTMYAVGRVALWSRDPALLPARIEDLKEPRFRRVALANPEHAPYGKAAEEALRAAGIYEELKPRLVYAENVRQAWQFAESGNVEVAFVALSLVRSNAVGEAVAPTGASTPQAAGQGSGGASLVIPTELHRRIDQAMAVCGSDPGRQAAGKRFVELVSSDRGRAIMRRYGFLLPGESLAEIR